MIDTYYLYILAVTVAWIWGFEYVFKPGEIFSRVGDWIRDVFPEWICKPLFDCKYCMSSVHGTIMFAIFLSGYPWPLWILFCFCLTGITAMIDR